MTIPMIDIDMDEYETVLLPLVLRAMVAEMHDGLSVNALTHAGLSRFRKPGTGIALWLTHQTLLIYAKRSNNVLEASK